MLGMFGGPRRTFKLRLNSPGKPEKIEPAHGTFYVFFSPNDNVTKRVEMCEFLNRTATQQKVEQNSYTYVRPHYSDEMRKMAAI